MEFEQVRKHAEHWLSCSLLAFISLEPRNLEKAYRIPAAVVESVSVVTMLGAAFAASLLLCLTLFTLEDKPHE